MAPTSDATSDVCMAVTLMNEMLLMYGCGNLDTAVGVGGEHGVHHGVGGAQGGAQGTFFFFGFFDEMAVLGEEDVDVGQSRPSTR